MGFLIDTYLNNQFDLLCIALEKLTYSGESIPVDDIVNLLNEPIEPRIEEKIRLLVNFRMVHMEDILFELFDSTDDEDLKFIIVRLCCFQFTNANIQFLIGAYLKYPDFRPYIANKLISDQRLTLLALAVFVEARNLNLFEQKQICDLLAKIDKGIYYANSARLRHLKIADLFYLTD